MKRSAAIVLSLLSATCGATIAVETTPARPRGRTVPPPRVQARPVDPPVAAVPPTVVSPPQRTTPSVRVILTKATAAGAAKVKVKGAWTLVAADGAAVRSGASLDDELVLGSAGAALLGADFPLDAELRPAVEGDLRVGLQMYAGALRVERGPDGKCRAMIATDVETYVAQVVNSEIPAAFPPEAQRTQAIIARTYALRSTVRTSPDAPLVLTDVGGIDQEFSGLSPVAEHRRVAAEAARSTCGVVLLDHGAPLLAYYHSTCGGTTCPGEVVFGANGAAPALKGGVACPWCTTSKYFRWDARIAAADVAKAAGMTGALDSFVVAEKTAGGRAASFDVTVVGKTKRIRAADFRLRVGASAMRSTLIDDSKILAGELVLSGRGWGHGVGLCQMGAKTLAEKGMTAEAIVAVYYPGAVPEKRW